MDLIKPGKRDLIMPEDIPVNLVGGQYCYYYANFIKYFIRCT